MSKNLGGQRRHIHCDCGKAFVGHPQEVNKMFMRHQLKYCPNRGEREVFVPTKFVAGENGFGGVTQSKRGNLVYKASDGVMVTNGAIVEKASATRIKETIKENLKEIEDTKK
jgi:hypothetical protein